MNTSIRRHRRLAAAAVLGTALTLVLAGCGGDDDDSAAEPSALDPDADLTTQTIVVSNWEAYMPDDIAEVVKERTGATVEITSHATNEDMVAKVTGSGGEGLDVVFGSQPYLEALARAGMLEPLDTDFLENWGNLESAAVDIAEVDGDAYWAPYTWGTTGICYRADLVEEAPTSWYDLLEPSEANKGKVTMMGTERWAMLPALKALGHSVNSTDEGELNEAKELMLAAKPNLLAYDDSTFYERLISGEATMVQAWDGWCNYGTAEDENIKFVVPEEGSDLWSDGIAVLKSSESKEAAYAFIDTILDAKTHAWVEENILYNIPNEAALAEVPPELLESFDTLGARRDEMLSGENMIDVGDDAAAIYNQIITEVTAS